MHSCASPPARRPLGAVSARDRQTSRRSAYYDRARTASDAATATIDLDTTARTWEHDTVTFRFALLHMIEETARHAGHIDAIRQQLDGTTGYLPNNALY